MRLRWTPVLSVLLALICLWTTPCAAVNDSVPLCSRSPLSYAGAKKDHPSLASALDTLEKRGIATWYSDRVVNGDYTTTAQEIVAACGDDTRLSIVVYGLPNKDCEAGYSSSNGVVQNADDYATFIDTLVEIVGDRKALYVLEPDAVGLIADGGCAVEFGYKQNLLVAIEKLTVNENAEIYVDVGFWTLYDPAKAASVAAVVRELVVAGRGRVKGITLNTSNYRPTKDMAQLCGAFQSAYNSTDMHCIIDTARNFNDTSSEEWCNRRTGGIGHPPTSNTGIENIDYFVWIKPPGESDGECDKGHSSESMVGPEAGVFFPEAFVLLWNNGYLHEVEGMPEVSLKSKGSKHTVVIVLCVLAVVAIAAVAFFVHHRRRTKEAGLNYSRAYFA